MDQHTSSAKDWLDRRYSRSTDGRYKSHQPIRGLQTKFAEPNVVIRLARTCKILEWLNGLEFDTVLDIGGGEGYLAALIRDLFHPSVVHTCDLSVEANFRAREIFGIEGFASDAASLPFDDGAYDLVICSEVIEHLSRPALAIAEAMRVSRRHVIVSTAEFSPLGEFERWLRVQTLDRSYPHAELNWFAPGDFRLLMGDETVLGSQYRTIAHRLAPAAQSRESVERFLGLVTDVTDTGVDQTGVIAVRTKDGPRPAPRPFAGVEARRMLDRLLDGPADESSRQDGEPSIGPALAARLRCVLCGSGVAMKVDAPTLACASCGQSYGAERAVPVMLAPQPGDGTGPPREAVSAKRLAGGDPAREQQILALMAQLHNSRAGRHGPTVHWLAGQFLRILWLVRRPEPVGSRVRRIVRRLTGGTDQEEAAALATLEQTLAAPPPPIAPPDSGVRP